MQSTPYPIIGVTSPMSTNASGSPVLQLGQAYIDAIQKAGGIPLVIPIGIDQVKIKSLLSRLDGLLLSGGGDIDPRTFKGASHPKVYGTSPERDSLEFYLLEEAVTSNKPFLAICRGIQVLNVAFGGDLYTHIQDQVEKSLKHDWFPKFPRDKLAHTVRLIPGSKLHRIFNTDEIRVNSLHHQGIKTVGKGLKATAFAPDGLVEGLEVDGAGFALGVQWHPECLPDDTKMQDLFKAFISAC